MNNLQKRRYLIRKLFKEVAKETVGAENLKKVKLSISIQNSKGASYCGNRYNRQGEGYILIGLDLNSLEIRVNKGFSPSYYKSRPDRLNKYIIKNRHNALRFILYHEARHAWQRLNNKNRNDEFDADTWALAHLKTKKPDQTIKPVQTFIPKATEYIRLYNLGYTTSKIALLCKVKDPRSVRYYLTKAGISLRRKF